LEKKRTHRPGTKQKKGTRRGKGHGVTHRTKKQDPERRRNASKAFEMGKVPLNKNDVRQNVTSI